MDKKTNIPDRNYYFLICDVPAIDARHRTGHLNLMGFIADNDKEDMVNYFQRAGKSTEPVIFIFQNKIRSLGMFMDREEFEKSGIKTSYDEIPRLRLGGLIKQQAEDMELMGYHSLSRLPDYRKTKGVCELAVLNDPYNICHVPDYMLSPEIIDSALEREGNTLRYIPRERLNAGMCRKAVGNDFMSLRYVPSGLKSEELCRMAVKGAVADPACEGYRVLSYIPYSFIRNEAIRQFNIYRK